MKNPLFERLTRNAKPPSLRATVWLAFGLAAVGLAGCVAGLGTLPAFQTGVEHTQSPQALWQAVDSALLAAYAGMLAFALLALISLPLAAGVTAAQTSRDVRSEAYILMHLTPVTNTQLVQGYLLVGLHRVRLLLALVVGLTPAWIGGMLNGDLRLSILPGPFFFHPTTPGPYQAYHLIPLDVIGLLLEFTAFAAGILTLFLLAAAMGVALALWWRKVPVAAAIIAPLVMLLGALPGFVALWAVVGPGAVRFSQCGPCWPLLGFTAGLCIPIPVLLAWGAMRLARRWV